jgi:hypothetical protein
MNVHFKQNPHLERELLASAELATVVEEAATAAGGEAERLGQGVASTYRVDIVVKGAKARLEANARDINAASWIEFGTPNLPATAPLRNGAEAAGLKPG